MKQAAPAGRVQAGQREARATWLIITTIAILTIGSLAGVAQYVAEEKERTQQAWQVRLGLVADSRRAALDDWLLRQRQTVDQIAQNETVRLYVSENKRLRGVGEHAEAAAMLDFVRTMLAAKALETGFATPVPAISANISTNSPYGIALIDPNGQVMTASPGFAGLSAAVRRYVLSIPANETGFIDLHANGAEQRPGLGFFAPIYAHQQAQNENTVIARVVGLRAPDQGFFTAMQQPGDDGSQGETWLLRDEGHLVRILDVAQTGENALQRSVSADSPNFAAVALTHRPGGFGLYRNINGELVLGTSRQMHGAPWLIMRQINADQALAASEQRLFTLMTVVILAIALVLAGSVALWRHGSSLRAAKAASALRNSVHELNRLSHFLQLVTDSQPTCILALDEDGRVTFANQQIMDSFDLSDVDLIGKSLKAVLGPEQARELALLNEAAIVTGEQRQATLYLQKPTGETRLWKTTHVRIAGGTPKAEGATSAVLLVLDDVTDMVEAQKRQENTLRQLITTVLKVVDRRDPYSAHHSERVAEVAKVLAKEMQLESEEIETAEIAGALMNLGKVFVPSDILTKQEALTDDELEQIQTSISVSAELLQHIDFPGPVVETLRQVHERWDGQGQPNGKLGEDILAPARVVALANSFVAMVSARAYRPGTPIGDAVRQLAEDMDRRYDPRAVSALMNFVSNKGGFRKWVHFTETPDGDSAIEARRA